MRPSLVTPGKLLPESYEDFQRLEGGKYHANCCKCEQSFSPSNTHSPAGWRETQISGMCEDCFDALFEGDDE